MVRGLLAGAREELRLPCDAVEPAVLGAAVVVKGLVPRKHAHGCLTTECCKYVRATQLASHCSSEI